MKTITTTLLAIATTLILAGCATDTPAPGSKTLSKQSGVLVLCETDDLIFPQAIVDQSALPGVTRRIAKRTAEQLTSHNIKAETTGNPETAAACLTIKITTIETVVTTSPGMWMPVAKQEPRIKYSVTLEPRGNPALLTYQDQRNDESLDTLTQKIAERVAQRTSKYFK